MKAKFYLRTSKQSSAKLYIYGSLPELGAGNPNEGIALDQDLSNPEYPWTTTIDINTPPSQKGRQQGLIWYSYFYKTKFGSIVREVCPKRFINISNCNCSFYDTFDKPTPIGDIIVRFRVHYNTNYGQELYVCGDPVELGKWNPKRAVLLGYVGDGYWEGTIRLPLNDKPQVLYYKYIVFTSARNYFWEGEENHRFELSAAQQPTIFEINDVYHWNDPTNDVYSTLPFTNVLNRRPHSASSEAPVISDTTSPDKVKITFIVKSPHVRPNQQLVVVGSSQEIGNWHPGRGVRMDDSAFPEWKATVIFDKNSLPFEYKYCIIDKASSPNPFANGFWETRPNRICQINSSNNNSKDSSKYSIFIDDWITNPNSNQFKGFGITAPLFSIHTDDSLGIGQYTDLNKLVDYCNLIGSSMINLLPLNDTTTDGSWSDSNPYRHISAFALHPIYIDLQKISDLHSEITSVLGDLDDFKNEISAQEKIDYPRVFAFKMQKLHQIFALIRGSLEENEKFNLFINQNSQWLEPYALFSVLREKNGTVNYHQWRETQNLEKGAKSISDRQFRDLLKENSNDLVFYYWIQFVCDDQFKAAKAYARKRRVVLKCDVQIGVPVMSADCWLYPSLFNIDMATVPFTSSNSHGNLNYCYQMFNEIRNENDSYCPSYNWPQNATTDFSWWRLRLRRLADLFDAIELEHIFEFFRTWDIPINDCVRSLLGHYEPSLSYSKGELKDRGLFDFDFKSFTKPEIRWSQIQQRFGSLSDDVATEFFSNFSHGNKEDIQYTFKNELNTEVKIHEYLLDPKNQRKFNITSEQERIEFEIKLFELLSNVLLIEDKSKRDHYNVRCQAFVESVGRRPTTNPDHFNYDTIESSAWKNLSEQQKSVVKGIYYDYFVKRQKELWLELSNSRFQMLKESTNMLICAEEISQSDEVLSKNIQNRGFISLRVQRVPETSDPSSCDASTINSMDIYGTKLFDKIREFPYFSIATPSTVNMPSIRGWWEEENRDVIKRFWQEEIWRNDEPPPICETWIQEIILRQHLWAQSMWTIFLLQDLVDIDDRFRLQSPSDERINDPNDKDHHWNYRYPFSIEELISASDLSFKIRDLVKSSGRI